MGARRTLDDHLVDTFVGRGDELSVLGEALDPAGPVVTFVHGVPGVGTTALLERFAVDGRRRGARVVAIDCRTVEPTPAAVRAAIAALGAASGSSPISAGEADPPCRDVLLFDHFSAFRLLDAWFRLDLLPGLPPSYAVVIASDEPPSPAWRASAEPSAAVRLLHLDVLPRADALALLAQHGIEGDDADRIHARTRGLPLALHVAATTAQARGASSIGDAEVADVAAAVSDAQLATLSPRLRAAVEAIAVARRGTARLVGSVVSGSGPELLDDLAALPFVRLDVDGLAVHEAIRAPLVARLRALDPDRFRAYRRAAWALVEQELAAGSGVPTWRATADLLYLIDHPLLHDAFFPPAGPLPTVEPAGPEDLAQAEEIASAHLPPSSAGTLVAAARHGTGELRVARRTPDDVAGVLSLLERTSLGSDPVVADPVVEAIRADLQAARLPVSQDALVVYACLSRRSGDHHDETTAALWLDLKRTYLERREHLRRVYAVVSDLPAFLAAAGPLGFVASGAPIDVGGVPQHVTVLDMGPAGVDGWLSRLASEQIGHGEVGPRLDAEQRTVSLRGRDIALSPLEFGVLQVLLARDGRAVSRAELIRTVWGHTYTGGSNVVDAVVRTLRTKLGDDAGLVEAVRGIGYRVARPSTAPDG